MSYAIAVDDIGRRRDVVDLVALWRDRQSRLRHRGLVGFVAHTAVGFVAHTAALGVVLFFPFPGRRDLRGNMLRKSRLG